MQWLLGEDATREGVPQLQWLNMPESWGVFVLIAAVLGVAAVVAWMYLREIETCPRPVKWLLAVLRFSVLLLLIVLLLQPSISFQQTHSLKPVIAVLRDASMSFGQQDVYDDIELAERVAAATGWSVDDIMAGRYSRAEILQQVLRVDDYQVVERMRQRGSLRIADFAESVNQVAMIPAATEEEATRRSPSSESASGAGTPFSLPEPSGAEDEVEQTPDSASTGEGPLESSPPATTQGRRMPPLVPTGRGTDIWQALNETLSDANRLSSIVLFSDGQHNGTEDVMEAARLAAEKNIRVFTVGVGDPARPRNLAVTDVYSRNRAQANEQFEIEALIYAEDVPISEVAVRLIEQQLDAEGQIIDEREVDEQTLVVPPQGGRLRADFQHVVANPGRYTYTVQVDSFEGERETGDNQLTSSMVEVVDEQVRVLLIAGSPSWEYQLVQRLLQRDQNISLSCWLQTMDPERPQEGNRPISELPRTIEQLAEYNVIMLFDPDPREFDEEWVRAMQHFCRVNAGGVLYKAGPKYTNMFMSLNRLAGFKQMLPVRFGDDDFYAVAEADLLTSTIQQRAGSMSAVRHNLDHPVMSFTGDLGTNESLWASMPSIFWSFPTLAPKPAARVLMERVDRFSEEGKQPLLVTGRYGAGSVLYMGFNGTWRWRRVGAQAQYFDRFWIQVVRFLVETRSLQGTRRGMIDPDRSTYELGDRVTLIAQVLNEQYEPLTSPNITAVVRGEEGRVQSLELPALPGQPGHFETSFVAQRTGVFEVRVSLPGTDEMTGVEPVTFRVQPPSIEAQNQWLNERLLREIADTTGGAYLSIDQLDQLGELLPVEETITEYNSPPEPIWDIRPGLRWTLFLLPFLLLTVEWAVRKRYRLM